MLLDLSSESYCLWIYLEVFSPCSFTVSVLTLRSLILLSWFLYRVRCMTLYSLSFQVEVHSACTICWLGFFFSVCIFDYCIKSYVASILIWVYFKILYSVPLFFMSVFDTTVSYQLNSGHAMSPLVFFLVRLALAIHSLHSFHIIYFSLFLSVFVMNIIGLLIVIVLDR